MLDKDDKYNHLYPALTFTLVGLAAAAGPAARRAAPLRPALSHSDHTET